MRLKKKGGNSKKILSVIAYYNEPIDLYSLAVLSDVKNISAVEVFCDLLVKKLVLTKRNESYEINEFATKFIIVKIIPNKIEAQYLNNKISSFKFERRKILRNLEENRSNIKLNTIMLDWVPRNNIEKIAIAEAYALYLEASQSGRFQKKRHNKVEYITKKFLEIESYSHHPYVKFQKARVFTYLLQEKFNKDYLDVITKGFEDAIFSIKFDYQYIYSTQSFAAVLWLYAIYLMRNFDDYSFAARNLEEAKDVCEKFNIKDRVYNKILEDLSGCYDVLYRRTRDKSFLALKDAINKANNRQKSFPQYPRRRK